MKPEPETKPETETKPEPPAKPETKPSYGYGLGCDPDAAAAAQTVGCGGHCGWAQCRFCGLCVHRCGRQGPIIIGR